MARLGALIREQRERAELSLRELAQRANVSNPYLSQLERGLHEPSVRVLTSIAKALNMSADALLRGAGLVDAAPDQRNEVDTEEAIRRDPRLTDDQKESLLAVYRAYVSSNVGG